MKVLGKLEHNGKEYGNHDIISVIPINQLNFNDSFYGGNVAWFGKTADHGVYLCLNRENQVIDILVDESQEAPNEPVADKQEQVKAEPPKTNKPFGRGK